MSDSRDQHDELRDRLADRALRELLSGETPPDLADSILAASKQTEAKAVSTQPESKRSNRSWLLGLTTAACIVIVAGFWAVERASVRHAQDLRGQKAVAAHKAEGTDRAVAAGEEMSEALVVEGIAGFKEPEEVRADDYPTVTFGAVEVADAAVANKYDGRAAVAATAANADGPVRYGLPTGGYGGGYAEDESKANRMTMGGMGGGGYGGGYGGVAAKDGEASGGYGGYGGEIAEAGRPAAPTGNEGYGGGYGAATAQPNQDAQAGSSRGRGSRPEPSADSNFYDSKVRFEPQSLAVEITNANTATLAIPNGGVLFRPTPSKSKVEVIDQLNLNPSRVSGARGLGDSSFIRQAAIKKELVATSEQLAEVSKQLNSTAIQTSNRQAERLVDRLSELQHEYKQLEQTRAAFGRGAGQGGDQYTRIHENPFAVAEGEAAVSTFSIDVDTAAYTNTRQYLLSQGQLPPPDAVRLEEFVNYFEYDYQPPADDTPFASSIEIASCPWQPKHRLVRIGIKGKVIDREERPSSNLVFLVDVSGSMNDSNKLPLVVEGLKQLTHELGEDDKVAIVVYANKEGLVLPSTRGDQKDAILAALSQLKAGGSTAGGAGIQLAYQLADENFFNEGTNRVILCTDGDFNVGVTSTADLERMAEEKAKSGVFLTVLGFGRGNLNDAMMESISNKGNGNYHYVDNSMEARKVLVRQMSGTLVTIAKDVKIQVEFNPAQVAGYRLLGYENRMLAREDFNDDTKDAGEIGAGHMVTALYEVVPAGGKVDTASVEPLKYQQEAKLAEEVAANEVPSSSLNKEMLELRIRYKQPDGNTSQLLKFPVVDEAKNFAAASDDFRFAASVVGFGLLLRNSQYKGDANIDAILEIATAGAKKDEYGYREEFVSMVKRAKALGLE